MCRIFCLLALLVMPATAMAQVNWDQVFEQTGAARCPDAPLTCVTLPMPFDHQVPGDNRQIDIRFGVHRASERSRGTLFYATGGPGSSGIALAEEYLAELDSSIRSQLDIVFWEQRGTGAPYTVICPAAQAAFDLSPAALADPQALITLSQMYVTDCIGELPNPEILPYLATDQAIRDLESFRTTIGGPTVWAYGESYGTQFMQQYVAAFPQAVEGVVIAGVLDLTLPFPAYYASYTSASEAILTRLLADCDGAGACAADMGKPAAQVFADIAARLADSPVTVPFPMPDGTVQPRQLSAKMWSLGGFYGLYTPAARGAYLSALARAGQGDYLPFLRLAYANGFLDSATLTSIADQTQLPAAYFAILCSDFSEGSPDPNIRAEEVIASAQRFAPEAPRLLVTYYSDRMICAFWPNKGRSDPRSSFPGGDFPTLVLTADTDPITPSTMAYDVFANVQNGSLITMENGPHVIWTQGLTCPNYDVKRLLLGGDTPVVPVQFCTRPLVEGYVPLLRSSSAFDIAAAIAPELATYPELAASPSQPVTVGCNHGGTMHRQPTNAGLGTRFRDCALWEGITLNGQGTVLRADIWRIGVTLTGTHIGELRYQDDPNSGTQLLQGTFDGAPVGTPMPLP